MRRMYSENQIKKIVEGSSSEVVQALQNQDIEVGDITADEITCNELKEQYDTDLIDFSDKIKTEFAKSHNFYAKLQVKHNILYIVLSGSFVAGTSAGTNPTLTDNLISLIPESIKSKIYRMDGTNLTQARDTISYISFNTITKRVGATFSGGASVVLDSPSSSEFRIIGYSFGTIAEDSVCQLDYRVFLAL